MRLSSVDRVRELARLAGISIVESEIDEVAHRFDGLLRELDGLTRLDLGEIQPVTVFPEEKTRGV